MDGTAERIERALLRVKGVRGARVCMIDGEIAEVHVAAEPGMRAKNIARDVRSYLAAIVGLEVNHQKISVATCTHEAGAGTGGAARAAARDARPLFRSVNLLIEGLCAQAQVELALGERRLLGSASGVPVSLGTERLIVMATLDAVQHVVSGDLRLVAGELLFTRLGAGEAAVVEILVVRTREEQRLVGACSVGRDRLRAVALATLAGLNRVLPQLVAPDWVEYQVDVEPREEGGDAVAERPAMDPDVRGGGDHG